MLVFFKAVHSVLSLLNSEKSRWQIAAGLSFGMLMGLSPLGALHSIFLFLLVCLLRVNFAAFFVSLAFFKLFGILLAPVWDAFGYFLLVDCEFLRPFWIAVTTGLILSFFHFNNTVMVGSIAAGLILFAPVSLMGASGIQKYRLKWREKIQASTFVKALKATPLYSLYAKYQAAKEKLGLH